MQGFIEVTAKQDNVRIMLPLSQIMSICEHDDGDVFIETGFNERKGSTGIYVKETYDEVRKIIAKQILFS